MSTESTQEAAILKLEAAFAEAFPAPEAMVAAGGVFGGRGESAPRPRPTPQPAPFSTPSPENPFPFDPFGLISGFMQRAGQLLFQFSLSGLLPPKAEVLRIVGVAYDNFVAATDIPYLPEFVEVRIERAIKPYVLNLVGGLYDSLANRLAPVPTPAPIPTPTPIPPPIPAPRLMADAPTESAPAESAPTEPAPSESVPVDSNPSDPDPS